ncbi:MAG: carboxypeptidase-like regulatory domain-containing protein [Planctomycetia bacterium]
MRARRRLLAPLLAAAALLATLLLARWMLREPGQVPLGGEPGRERVAPPSTPGLEAAAPPPPAPAGTGGRAAAPAGVLEARAARIRGRVEDRAGRPLAGVALVLHAVDPAARRGLAVADGAVLAEGRCEPDGSFDLPAPRAGHARLGARAAGLAPASVLVDAQGAQVTLVLGAPARLVLELVDAQGAPAGAVQGRVELLQGDVLGQVALDGARVVLEGLAPGSTQVRAWLDDGRVAAAGPVQLRAGAEAALLLVLEAAAQVAGTVLDAGSEAPLAGAEVVLAAPGRRVAAGSTDAAGRFGPWPAGLPGEPVQVSVTHPGYAPALEGLPVLPAGGLPSEVQVHMEAAAGWQGVVVDRGGQPVAGAEGG